MRVLIVDDEIGICRHLQNELRKEGYDVKYNTSSVDVLKELKDAVDKGKAYDLLLLDIKMPGMDGFSLMEKIREARFDLDVIVITGHGDEDKAIESIRLGAMDYLRKPISLEELHTSIFRVQQKMAEKGRITPEPRILIVDDEKDLCARIKRELKKEDYRIAGVYDGVEGLDYFRNNRVDIIITDIKMSKMSGLEMIERCREITDDFVSIVITGHGNHEKAIEALKLGVLNYFKKPISLEELVISIRKGVDLLCLRRSLAARRRELEIETALKDQYSKNLEMIIDGKMKELRREKRFSENIIASIPESLLVVDKDLRIKSANHAFYETFQIETEPGNIKGTHISDILGDGDYSTKLAKLFEAKDIMENFDLYYQSEKFGERIFNITARKMLAAKPAAEGGLIVLQDITGRKKAENELRIAYQKLKEIQEQLIQSGKMAAMGQLAAGISHELNQPLTGIRGFAQAALMDLKEENPIRNDLNKIVEQVDRMDAIIKTVRFFSRKSDFNMVEIDINQTILKSLMLLSQQLKTRNIRVIQDLGSNIPRIQGDANQLQQAFLNIISNARDAIISLNRPDGGEICIHTSLSRDKDNIEIFFRDTGCGVSEANLQHMFSPFFTTKSPAGGMGLGLSITYRLIENHQGKIDFQTQEGEGTTFTIILPLKRTENATI